MQIQTTTSTTSITVTEVKQLVDQNIWKQFVEGLGTDVLNPRQQRKVDRIAKGTYKQESKAKKQAELVTPTKAAVKKEKVKSITTKVEKVEAAKESAKAQNSNLKPKVKDAPKQQVLDHINNTYKGAVRELALKQYEAKPANKTFSLEQIKTKLRQFVRVEVGLKTTEDQVAEFRTKYPASQLVDFEVRMFIFNEAAKASPVVTKAKVEAVAEPEAEATSSKYPSELNCYEGQQLVWAKKAWDKRVASNAKKQAKGKAVKSQEEMLKAIANIVKTKQYATDILPSLTKADYAKWYKEVEVESLPKSFDFNTVSDEEWWEVAQWIAWNTKL